MIVYYHINSPLRNLHIPPLMDPIQLGPNQDSSMDKQCQCKKIETTLEESACSDFSATRGPNQRVISFSLFGVDNPKYKLQDLRDNLQDLPKFYPGYVMRIYHDRVNVSALCDLFCHNDLLDFYTYIQFTAGLGSRYSILVITHGVMLNEKFGMLWRYIPLLDPLVSEFHARDLDSRFLNREVQSVRDWQRSGKSLHIMRDHPSHNAVIMGGLFGMRKTIENQPLIANILHVILEKAYKCHMRQLDQYLLKLYLWPTFQHDSFIQDSYHCHWHQDIQPFSTRRVPGRGRNFLGSTDDSDVLNQSCPIQCRPKENKDWTIC
eukprot:TCALIF_05194-PA protein Name:"Protein of unknown function" AED:0.17 eAED:0.19 QI:35/0.33/0/1/0/0/4/0/319